MNSRKLVLAKYMGHCHFCEIMYARKLRSTSCSLTRKPSKFLLNLVFSETPQNDPFNINGGQTVSGQIGQQGENIDQSGTVNNGGNGVDSKSTSFVDSYCFARNDSEEVYVSSI